MGDSRRLFAVLSLFCILASCTAGSFTSSPGRVPVERSLNNTAWGYQLVSSPVRAGAVSQRFEVRPGDCASDEWGSDCDRGAERSDVASTGTWGPNDTVWISGSVYVPQGFQTNSADTNIMSIKTSTNSAPNLPNPEPLGLSFSAGRFRAKLGWLDASREQHIDRIDLGAVSQFEGRWTDFVIGMGPGTGNRFVVYLDGRLILNKPTRYLDAQSFYLKYGIYRGAADFTNVLYWDEIRMGGSQAEVAFNESSPVD